jgi:GGDEF domain-containing protein
MPTDLLLPAFALTLLANAVLVAVAIRALRSRASWEDNDRPVGRTRPDIPMAPATIEPPARAETSVVRGEPLAAGARARPPGTPAPVAVGGEPAPAPRGPRPAPPASVRTASGRNPSRGEPTPAPKAPRDRPATAPPSRPKPPAKGRTKRAATSSNLDPDAPRSEALRGGRRRFSLPPLDDDHDRVVRSIETFLLGGEAADTEAQAGSTAEATTVAVVAIDGLEPNATRADRQAFDAAVATVERTLRGAARAADRVTATGRGRFRIVLPATGELAARAYLRRVRASVEPSLSAAAIPLGLVTATSTVLDEAAGIAIAQAEARLDTALASAARRKPVQRPRAAAD